MNAAKTRAAKSTIQPPPAAVPLEPGSLAARIVALRSLLAINESCVCEPCYLLTVAAHNRIHELENRRSARAHGAV